LIEVEPLVISSILLLELALLEEPGRIKAHAKMIFAELRESLPLSLRELPFTEVAVVSLQQKWTRDPVDRFALAEAFAREARMITKDRSIRRHFKDGVW
jgi:PIN domain nuclease of toxin-antitoxin system